MSHMSDMFVCPCTQQDVLKDIMTRPEGDSKLSVHLDLQARAVGFPLASHARRKMEQKITRT